MTDDPREKDTPKSGSDPASSHAPHDNRRRGFDGDESVVTDNDLAMRGAGQAGESAGSGVPGLGGAPGGTPNYGGVGLPGGNRKLGAGHATSDDARLGGTMATGGLGTGGNARSGRGQTPATGVLPGGATRPVDHDRETGARAPTEAEEIPLKRADQDALQSGAMMNDRPGSSAANDIPTHGDEAATRARKSHIAQSGPLRGEEEASDADAPQDDPDMPMRNAGSRSTPRHPVPEQPSPGLMDRPGPEAEV